MGRLTHLLDTDICVDIARSRARVRDRFEQFFSDELVMSVITFGELRYGVERSGDRTRARQQLSLLMVSTTVIPLTARVGEVYGQLRQKLAGMPIGPNDLWIAAHALANDLTLVTNNEREFSRVPNLRIENWTKPA